MSWEMVKLGCLSTIVRGSSPRPQGDKRYYGGTVPRLMIEDLTRDGKYVIPQVDSLTEEGAKLSRPMKKGELVITVSGRTGVPAILNVDACIHDGFVGFRELSNTVDIDYLYHYLSSLTAITSQQAVGAIFKNLTTEQLKNLEIPLPPLSTQQRIAEILDKADTLRRKDQALLKKYDDLAQAIFMDMFGDNVDIVKLKDITTKITDGVHAKPNYIESGVPFLSVKNATNKFLDFRDTKFISEKDHESYTKRCKPEFEDILYTKVGATYGRAALINTEEEFSIYVSLALIKPDKSKIYPHFLNFVMNSDFVKKQADRRIKGAGVPDLHLIEIKDFDIPLPVFDKQLEFSDKIEKINYLLNNVKLQIIHSKTLFQSLLQQAFKGELK